MKNNNILYYYFSLKSKDANLYRNINIIAFLEIDKWNNMNEQIILNTWDHL